MKTILKLFAGILLLTLILFGVFLSYVSMTSYKPEVMKTLTTANRNSNTIITGDTLRFMSWNIGYGGLGSEMDFFYDGGSKVRADQSLSNKYLDGIIHFISQQKQIDFWLLQEVDFDARRSYRINQSSLIANALSGYNFSTAINYKVAYVPVPVNEPMGRVKAGMMMLSAFAPEVEYRHAYPQISSWPERLFLLNRCFTESRFKLENGKYLVVFNTHNSAFVADQDLMNRELEVIRKRMIDEYASGNYVVAGGDWNMNPPKFKANEDYGGHFLVFSPVAIPEGLLPQDWHVAYDSAMPTNRHLDEAYQKGKTGTTTIDFFIVSPNIRLLSKAVIDLEFKCSDHNPVLIEITLD